MELLDALRLVETTMDILRDTDRHSRCSDRVYRQVMVAKIQGLMSSGVPEAISEAITQIENKPAKQSRARQHKEE